MQIDEFLAPRILIVSGKGGVGKTTVSAALALVAARQGRRACIAEVDRKGTLPKLFGGSTLGYTPRELAPGVWGMNIIPDEALAEYLEIQYHMKRVAKVFSSTHFIDFITTTAPGMKDILVLGKIWYLEQGRSPGPKFDTIIVDAPAAGHMLTFLSSPMGLSDAVRLGPIQRQAEWLVEMLTDPARTRVHLVTLAEEMPVSETIETAEALETRIKIDTGTVFANAVYPEMMTAGDLERLDEVLAGGLGRTQDDAGGLGRTQDDAGGLGRTQDQPGGADTLCAEADKVGLRLDPEDLEALTGYARFLDARRTIQAKHLRALKKAVNDPVIELPFLFDAGLDLPGIETIADAIEEQIGAL